MSNKKLSRRDFLYGTAAAAITYSLGTGFTGATTPRRRRPNIVMIVADDLGYGSLGCYGSNTIRTPHIDALAAGGVRLTSGYVTAAVCSPSRAGFMSGRYQQRHGFEFNVKGRDVGLSPGETTLASLMKGAGYATGMVGKWHLGKSEKQFPLARGFDEFYGFITGSRYATPRTPDIVTIPRRRKLVERPIYRGHKRIVEDTYLTDAFTREAVDFIHRHRDDPFFLYLAHKAPHSPLTAKGADVKRNDHIDTLRGRVYAAMITAMDDGIGQVTAALKELGLEEDTVVVFFSDNGGVVRLGADNGPLNGAKRYQYEGGLRIPFIVKWPGRLARGITYHEPVISLDLYPTFAAIAGAEKAMRSDHDGVNIIPYLNGDMPGSPHDRLFWRATPNRAVREGKWKLWQVDLAPPGSKDNRGKLLPKNQIPTDSPHGRKILLFDLSRDLGERVNVAQNYPDVVKMLLSALDEWESGLVEPAWPSHGSTIFERNGTPLKLFF